MPTAYKMVARREYAGANLADQLRTFNTTAGFVSFRHNEEIYTRGPVVEYKLETFLLPLGPLWMHTQ